MAPGVWSEGCDGDAEGESTMRISRWAPGLALLLGSSLPVSEARAEYVAEVKDVRDHRCAGGPTRTVTCRSFLLEGPPHGAVWVFVPHGTPVEGASSVFDVGVGSRLAVRFDGGLRESYPAQGTAAAVRRVGRAGTGTSWIQGGAAAAPRIPGSPDPGTVADPAHPRGLVLRTVRRPCRGKDTGKCYRFLVATGGGEVAWVVGREATRVRGLAPGLDHLYPGTHLTWVEDPDLRDQDREVPRIHAREITVHRPVFGPLFWVRGKVRREGVRELGGEDLAIPVEVTGGNLPAGTSLDFVYWALRRERGDLLEAEDVLVEMAGDRPAEGPWRAHTVERAR